MDAFDTVFPADSLEFCPHPAAQDVLICGTYNLEKSATASEGSTQKRTGQCLVYKRFILLYSRQIQSIDLPAVLDMKWCHRSLSAPPLLGVADSEGHISLHEWRETELESHSSISCAPSDVLCLSLDWSNRRHPSAMGSLIVSLSNGSLCLLSPSQGSSSGLSISDTWHAHDFEPWIAAWDYWDSSVLYSGGDDLKLKGWDTRQGFSQPTFTNKRFDAGITTIQSHPHIENLFAVGSYDNTVRLFDKRKPLVPVTQVDVGGGAWRVKWHPSASRKNDLLVACMHDGFKVVRFPSDDSAELGGGEIVKRFDSHTSLAYGADWSFAERGGETLIATCSFYDHSLYLWTG
ncbi:WD40 repeat-like protein [Mycena capillaripes]|nr:WD40 repeat-like protein [Mycena capillaripes]